MLLLDTNIKNSVCFSGHRPAKLFANCIDKEKQFKKLYSHLYNQILDCINEDFTDFFCGMAHGIDLMASDIVLKIKNHNPQIKHHAVYPFANQHSHYSNYWKNLFMNVLINSDTNTVLNPKFVRGCYQQRNKYLVDHCSRLIAIFDGNFNSGTGQTINYAIKKNIEVIIIHISDENFPIEIIP